GTAEVGKRVSQNVWLHGSVTEAAAGQLFATGNGSMLQVRGGADVMSCNASGGLCAYAGADLGFQHTQFAGESTPLFCIDDTGDSCMGNSIDESHNTLIGVARAGFDVGGEHLRWRPGVELAVGDTDVNGFNLTQSIAYRF